MHPWPTIGSVYSQQRIIVNNLYKCEGKIPNPSLLIRHTLDFDKEIENYKFEPFTIRVYFEWYEGLDEQMNDEQDSKVGNDASINDTKLQIQATINFEQKI